VIQIMDKITYRWDWNKYINSMED